jgi:hypothetical protein
VSCFAYYYTPNYIMPKHFLLLIGVSSSVLYANFVAWCRGQFVDDF